jgi:hypothetical protein
MGAPDCANADPATIAANSVPARIPDFISFPLLLSSLIF